MTTPRHLLPIALSAIRSLAAALAIAAASAATHALADSQTIGGVEWSYTVDGANATVTGANPAEGNLVIPDTLGGAAVTAIGDKAFENCSGLTGVELPAGLKDIGEFAFNGCTGLRDVAIPGNVLNIGQYAFAGCEGLTTLAIPEGVENIGGWAFTYCYGLTNVALPASLTNIGTWAFFYCTNLTSVTIPGGVTVIEDGVFAGCQALASVVIPEGVTNFQQYAFADCSSLASLSIPDSVTSIGSGAFNGCTSLASLSIPDSVTSFESSAFDGCTSLAALDVPGAWYGTTMLEAADVPEGCVVTYRGISPLAVATETLPKGRPGRAYEAALAATGGVEPYMWEVMAYEESAAASSFAETGTAQGWQEDDWEWDLALPFAFPFFGNTYTNAKINSNGLISFGPSSLRWVSPYDNFTFLETPIVAVLWADMETTSGNIYVDSGADAVTVRWAGTLGGNPVNCSATMAKDGTITLSYGAGNEDGGGIGISAGDGTNYVLSAKHQSGSMENAQDIVFTPAGLPPGLTLGADGTLAGTPEAAGTYSFTVVVTDAKGVSARKELSLEVAAPAPVEGVFARLAGTDELEAGEYVITGTKGGGREHYAMADELGGTGTTFIRRYGDSAVAAEGEEEISDPPESIVWTLEEGAQGWTIRNAEAGYVAFKGSGNSATFTAAAGSNACWTVMAGGAEGLFAVENAAKPERVLQYNGTSGQERFACYTNWGSRAQGLAFWKKGGAAKHAIEIDPAIEHGTIATVPAGSAKPGTMVEVTATPDTDGDWQLADVSVTYPTGETYSWSGTPFFFEMPDGDVFVTAVFSEGGVPPMEEAFVFGGDETGTVGEVVRFTVAPKEEGAEFFLADFSVPEGSGLGLADVATDYPEVRFTPDKAGWFCFVFEVADEGGFGARCIEVTGGDDPGPGPGTELRITKMEVRGGTVTLGYAGEAKSVEGTDDLAAGDSWRTVAGAAIDAENKTATLPEGKRFLRLSSEAGGGGETEEGTYLVVDLSGGPSAASWPVTNLDDVPAGGWSDEYKTTKLVLRKIPAGTFTMGSPTNEVGRLFTWDETQHQVTLTKPFYIGVFEVTQKQWALAAGSNPSSYAGDARPVENVSYEDVRGASAGAGWPTNNAVDSGSFLAILRAKTGLAFDLPTEAQWEYACRAGTTTALNSGKDLTDRATCPNMAEVGRYRSDTDDGKGGYGQHTAVGSYRPNDWGLYDMHGNVEEWCLDYYLRSESSEAAVDPKGPDSGTSRVSRGGSWNRWAMDCRSAYQFPDSPSTGDYSSGLRLACPAE